MIHRFFAEKDSTITNAYDSWLVERKEEANLGASDILESYVLYDRDGAQSLEISRFLVDFDFQEIFTKLNSVDFLKTRFVLKFTNAPHGETLPSRFTLEVSPLSGPWKEGIGLDYETLQDSGGVCWLNSEDGVEWSSPGGDYESASTKSVSFEDGDENLEVDISDWVEGWHDNPGGNFGVLVKFSDEVESGAESFFTKRFFARTSNYFYKRPVLEVQIDDVVSEYPDEGRERFRLDSPLFSATDNYLYYYNRPRSGLEDIPGNGETDPITISVNIEDESGNAVVTGLTPTWVSTGVYRVSARLGAAYSGATARDKWYIDGLNTPFYCGTFTICNEEDTRALPQKSILSIKNHKAVYDFCETLRVCVDAVPYGWNPNVFVSYYNDGRSEKLNLTETYYQVSRDVDNYIVCASSHSSGAEHTKLSYDGLGNYFNFNFSILEPGYMYTFSFFTALDGGVYRHPEQFRFRAGKDKERHS